MATLTPELAVNNPFQYRTELIDSIHDRTVHGRDLWNTVVKAGLIRKDTVHVESGVWGSWSNAQRKDIHLGAQSLPSRLRQQLIVNDTKIDYEQEIILRFMHELGHLSESNQINSGNNAIHDLLNTTKTVRSVNQNLGLSAIGSLDYYGPDMKFREDAAELTAMYAFNPEYLREYLDCIGNPTANKHLNSIGIAVVPAMGNEIFKVVESAAQEAFNS